MKRKLINTIFKAFLLTGMWLSASFAQNGLSILVVDDDNYSNPDHSVRITDAISSAGYSYTVFNAQDSMASPNADVMKGYDLVIWYTANDGKDSYFWNAVDEDNLELKSYLDNGGMLWAMGSDILYDRFGGAPDTFMAGDFVYDYFGIEQYLSQSKINDGGSGVPMLLKANNQTITSQDTIKWYVSGLWYADGNKMVSSAIPLYQFGDATYPLAGEVTAAWYNNGTSQTVFTWFDPYYMDTNENRTTLFKDILDHFDSFVTPPVPNDLKNKYLLSFDGINDYLRLADDTPALNKLDGAASYAIETWVYPKSDDIHNEVILKRWNQFALTFYQDANKRIYFTHKDETGSNTFVNSINNAITIGAWNHIAVISNADSNWTKMYVNGNDVTLQHYDALPLRSNTNSDNFYVGYGGSGTYSDSWIDEVRIQTAARTIKDLNYGKADSNYVVNDATALLLHFDEGEGAFTMNATADKDSVRLGGVDVGDNQEPEWKVWSDEANLPPQNFTLKLPAHGATHIITNNPDSAPKFSWNEAEDVNDNLNGYNWYLLDATKTVISDSSLKDTAFVFDYNTLLKLMENSDSLHVYWTVSAFDYEFTTSAQDTFALLFTKEKNQPPAASNLLSVQNGKMVFYNADSATYHFSWSSSASTEPVTYNFKLQNAENNTLFNMDTSATELTINLSSYFASAMGDTHSFSWQVISKTDQFEVPSENGPFLFKTQKQKESVLFVNDDNSSAYGQEIMESLDAIGLAYTTFECGNNGSGAAQNIPDSQTLNTYDIVLWFTGNDGTNLAFWNADDTTNQAVIDYLDQGGKLWINGNDFIYDRFGTNPLTFEQGSFVHTYLGIESFDGQSKVDDGGIGAGLLVRDTAITSLNITSQDTLDWRFKTLWYGDAFTMAEGAKAIYRMGPEDYVFANKPIFVLNHPGKFQALTSAFNMRHLNTKNQHIMRETLLFDVLSWMQNNAIVTTVDNKDLKQLPTSFSVAQNYPNPFNPSTTIRFGLPKAGTVEIAIFNVLGQMVFQHKAGFEAGFNTIKIDAQSWSSGLYFYNLKYENHNRIKKMMFIK